MTKKNDSHDYQVGLNPYKENVISAHFMTRFAEIEDLRRYTPKEFNEKSIILNQHHLEKLVLPSLKKASQHFIKQRVIAIKKRTLKNWALYELENPEQIRLSHALTETLFDRQFLKGPPHHASRVVLNRHLEKLLYENKNIQFVLPALPFKSHSPLKCFDRNPDFSEVNFLLALAEISQTLEGLIFTLEPTRKIPRCFFSIISDGKRFCDFLNEPRENVIHYQKQIKKWIDILDLNQYVKLIDYQVLMKTKLSPKLKAKKERLRVTAKKEYHKQLNPLFKPSKLNECLNNIKAIEPDPETGHPEGRFVPLFKSIYYSMHFESLDRMCQEKHEDYKRMYLGLIKNPIHAGALLISDFSQMREALTIKSKKITHSKLEKLHYDIITETWNATIEYISEIRSDRDLDTDPIMACYPDAIRWTIHSKPGQLGILTTTASGDPIQSWHGVGVFKKNKHNRIKLYTLPVSYLESIKSKPVLLRDYQHPDKNTLLFYIHPNIKFQTLDDFFQQLDSKYTRKRKL